MLLYSRFLHAEELLRKLFAIWECTFKIFASLVLGRKSLNNIRLTGAELWPARASPDHGCTLLKYSYLEITTDHSFNKKFPSQILMVLLLSILVSDLSATSNKISNYSPTQINISSRPTETQWFALLTLVIWYQKGNFKYQCE